MLSMLCKPKLSSCTTLGHASMTKISTSFTFQSPTNPLSLCLVHANAHLHAIVIFVIVSVTMCCLFPSADASLESDSKSLLKLKESFVGSDALLNWNASQPPCDGDKAAWTGLRCVNGAVTIVQLEGLGLRGLVDVDALAGIPTLRSVSCRSVCRYVVVEEGMVVAEQVFWANPSIPCIQLSTAHGIEVREEPVYRGNTRFWENQVDNV